ncbi:hypothetical protein IEQ34_025171 [Dendrobium chrysotoxum]|uniref:Uncharacterized protein n=1 Tax=Dendrobium chrysotoxum TaxID=161865 RepID=A0AAV7FJ50_DENCH|nr:hypothetical protein IEQ34_025171 [Dendrobium chrysotoxum]
MSSKDEFDLNAETEVGQSDPVDGGGELDDAELEAMKARVAEMEAEAAKLRELQAQANNGMGHAAGGGEAGADDTAMEEDKEEVDARSVYVGNVDTGRPLRRFNSISCLAERSTGLRYYVTNSRAIRKGMPTSNLQTLPW